MNSNDITHCPICDSELKKNRYTVAPGVRTIHDDKDHIFCIRFDQSLQIESIYATYKKYSIHWEIAKQHPIKIVFIAKSCISPIVEVPYFEPDLKNLKSQLNRLLDKHNLSQVF